MQPERAHLRPSSPELVIPDPDHGGNLPPEGLEVPLSSYWRRRIKDGDVVQVGGGDEKKARKEPKP